MKINKFLSEVMAELKKVSWPSKKDIIVSTKVVVTLSILAGVYIFGCDQVFSKIIEKILY
ncbi:MAG: preprotein translocase subunit SecE [Candidatus Muirbacterium halophilum]|nr:preprotein translocase subunit SecE [Candidatus Muirbacterium halophilum]MCK9477114.1 preprotein translocase subunit SecE [Candidatus Muirbacterium halophilum]